MGEFEHFDMKARSNKRGAGHVIIIFHKGQ
jgi:hypothetical protein